MLIACPISLRPVKHSMSLLNDLSTSSAPCATSLDRIFDRLPKASFYDLTIDCSGRILPLKSLHKDIVLHDFDRPNIPLP